MGKVFRWNVIHYETYLPDGKKVNGIAQDFLARIIQHETGLNDELYTDLIEEGCRFGDLETMIVISQKEFLDANN
ncbi:hypothetical protein B1F79_03695 [Coxiella-like endosymbiont of Rhipicephalus sanguineus]|uniref:peptide deformylase n=1 Tax=Coxiella-like endosymbiont of Rhipicephalus sanguineus TaxID=1955402 RepID=UPI00203E068E|nr:peptide deformylase [Coxiella-like endosymbiont of Rhipicephalus sanguineus]MBT8506621.1 hypothetical protein [Coxiella-like endosymbiont of Rhipicephalus sanguineus]